MSTTETKRKRRSIPDRVLSYYRREELAHARGFASRWYGLDIRGATLDADETDELRDLVARAGAAPERELLNSEQTRAEEYIAGVEALKEQAPRPVAAADRLIEGTRRLGRPPTAKERAHIEAGGDVAELIPPTGSTFNEAALSDEEVERMHALFEKAAGVPGFFAERAARAKLAAGIRQEDMRLLLSSSRPTKPPAPGGVVLPQQVYDDVVPPDGDLAKRYLHAADVLVLWAVVAMMRTARVAYAETSGARLEEDGNVLVVPSRVLLSAYADVEGCIEPIWRDSLERLGPRGAKWLDVENRGQEVRLRLGPRAFRYGLGSGEMKKP